jgi:Fe-S-cluster-containing dehydrogenase component
MKKWNLIIDVAKCFNCNVCTLACHDEYFDNNFPGYAAGMPRLGHRWIDIVQREKGVFPIVEVSYLPVTCNHCDDAPCLKAARNGAVQKRPDGIVIIVPEKAKGQKQLVESCPYGAIWWNEEQQLPQAWPFDAHLLDNGWTKTRGSQVCPTKAMRTVHVEDAEMQRMVKDEGLEVLHPEWGTRPRVYYKNLARFTKAFVAGSLSGDIAGVSECIAGAKVSLAKDSRTVAETVTDTFGGFKLGGIEEGSGTYRLNIHGTGFEAQSMEVVLGESIYVGVIDLGVVKPAVAA